ncbi:Nematocyte expressed protein 6 [Orchesella cincta]|uniref:Metalloendopeptidase n=1 Tax=Orchesella cincta TaxID=48709 RepID=A0A1D2MC29_ORCCI|nr:Nematocyte expressed protein 6 [Orchesella cincta]
MKTFPLLATLFSLLWGVHRILGVPIPNSWGTSDAKNETQDLYMLDQGSTFRDYNDSNEYIIVDDMIIQRGPSRSGLVNSAWPNGVVPYAFHSTINLQQRRQIIQAMSEISAITCITFRPVTRQDRYNLLFINDPNRGGCSSLVGWTNQRNQQVQISTQCSLGNAIHEIIHALGFFHEHTRNDRDNFVRVNFENIVTEPPGVSNNFRKDSELNPDAEFSYFGVPYNYDSIMHYGKTFFSKSADLNTIDVLYNPDAIGNGDKIGQRDYISDGDVQEMQRQILNLHKAARGQPTSANPATSAPATTTTSQSTASTPRTSVAETQTETTSAKPNHPICKVQPNLPVCKRKGSSAEAEQ